MDNSLNDSESPDFESLAQVGVNIHLKSYQVKIISQNMNHIPLCSIVFRLSRYIFILNPSKAYLCYGRPNFQA